MPSSTPHIGSIKDAIEDIRSGRTIILIDDDDRENEGDFVFAAEKCTPELVNTMMSYGRGLICQPMTKKDTERLHLPQQVFHNEGQLKTAFTVSIDATDGITTGISASDRCKTILTAADPNSNVSSLVRPGHIFPLEARDGGCLERPGHTEASVDLARLAGLKPQAVICEILNDQGEAMRLPELLKLGETLGVRVYTIRDLVQYRLEHEPAVQKVECVQLPTEYGEFQLHVYQSSYNQKEEVVLALTKGLDEKETNSIPLVRVHAEWSILNLINRLSNDCGSRLNVAMKMIADEPSGVILFLRHSPDSNDFGNQPGPDIWMENGTMKTIGASNPNMGFGMGAQILRDLGIRKMRILSNSNMSFKGIGNFGLEILERIPLEYQK